MKICVEWKGNMLKALNPDYGSQAHNDWIADDLKHQKIQLLPYLKIVPKSISDFPSLVTVLHFDVTRPDYDILPFSWMKVEEDSQIWFVLKQETYPTRPLSVVM